MIAAALFFTLMNLCIKAAHQKFGMGSGELVFWRMLFAAVVLGGLAKLQGKTFSSIFLAVLSFIVLRERISLYMQGVLLLGFAGVVLLLHPSVGGGQVFAASVGLCGGLLSGWAYLQVRELSLAGEPAWRVVFYLSLVGMIMGAVLATFTGWHRPSLQSLPYLLGIGASAMLAQLTMTHAYAVGRKFTVAALAYLTVVFSTLSGIILFNEQIGWQEWLGIGIIIAGGILSGLKK